MMLWFQAVWPLWCAVVCDSSWAESVVSRSPAVVWSTGAWFNLFKTCHELPHVSVVFAFLLHGRFKTLRVMSQQQ